jgi:hypothetical protein
VELATGHDAMITEPEKLTELLLEIAAKSSADELETAHRV